MFQLGHALAGEVPYAELRAQGPGLGVVPLVQQPHVERTVVPEGDRPQEGALHHGERLFAGDERRQERDLGAGFGRYGDRVAGDQRGVGHGHDVDQHEQHDQGDAHEHRGVAPDEPAVAALPDGPVRGPDEVEQQSGRGEGASAMRRTARIRVRSCSRASRER